MTGQDNRYPDFARGSQDMLWTGGEIRIAAGFGTDRLVSSSKFPPVADGNYRTDHVIMRHHAHWHLLARQ